MTVSSVSGSDSSWSQSYLRQLQQQRLQQLQQATETGQAQSLHHHHHDGGGAKGLEQALASGQPAAGSPPGSSVTTSTSTADADGDNDGSGNGTSEKTIFDILA